MIEERIVYLNGEYVTWGDATVHIMSHSFGRGSAIFEVISLHATASGPAIFRLQAHIDRLFKSAAVYYGDAAIGVLLSGMGADGAHGLKRIKDLGGRTIVQDQDSCVVFGMPAAAIKLGAVQHVTALSYIPQMLTRWVKSSPGVGESSRARSLREELLSQFGELHDER